MWHKCFATRIYYPIVVVHMSDCTTDTTRHTWHWCFGMCINYLIQNSHVSDCNTDNISNLGHRYFGLCIHYMTHVYLLYIWIYCHKLISLYIYLFPCIFLQTQMSESDCIDCFYYRSRKKNIATAFWFLHNYVVLTSCQACFYFAFINMYIYICISLYLCMYILIHVSMYIYIYMHIYRYINLYTCKVSTWQIYKHINVYVYIVYTYIYESGHNLFRLEV